MGCFRMGWDGMGCVRLELTEHIQQYNKAVTVPRKRAGGIKFLLKTTITPRKSNDTIKCTIAAYLQSRNVIMAQV